MSDAEPEAGDSAGGAHGEMEVEVSRNDMIKKLLKGGRATTKVMRKNQRELDEDPQKYIVFWSQISAWYHAYDDNDDDDSKNEIRSKVLKLLLKKPENFALLSVDEMRELAEDPQAAASGASSRKKPSALTVFDPKAGNATTSDLSVLKPVKGEKTASEWLAQNFGGMSSSAIEDLQDAHNSFKMGDITQGTAKVISGLTEQRTEHHYMEHVGALKVTVGRHGLKDEKYQKTPPLIVSPGDDPTLGECSFYRGTLGLEGWKLQPLDEDTMCNASIKKIIGDGQLIVSFRANFNLLRYNIRNLIPTPTANAHKSEIKGDKTVFPNVGGSHLGLATYPLTTLPLKTTIPYLRQPTEVYALTGFVAWEQMAISESNSLVVNPIFHEFTPKYVHVDPGYDEICPPGIDTNTVAQQLAAAAANCNSLDLFFKAVKRTCDPIDEVPSDKITDFHGNTWLDLIVNKYKKLDQNRDLIFFAMFHPAGTCMQCRLTVTPSNRDVQKYLRDLKEKRAKQLEELTKKAKQNAASNGHAIEINADDILSEFHLTCCELEFPGLDPADDKETLTLKVEPLKDYLKKYNITSWDELTVLRTFGYGYLRDNKTHEDDGGSKQEIDELDPSGVLCFIAFPTKLVLESGGTRHSNCRPKYSTSRSAKSKSGAKSRGVSKIFYEDDCNDDPESGTVPGACKYWDGYNFPKTLKTHGCKLICDKNNVVTGCAPIPEKISGFSHPQAKMPKPSDFCIDPLHAFQYMIDPKLSQLYPKFVHKDVAKRLKELQGTKCPGSIGSALTGAFAAIFENISESYPCTIENGKYIAYFTDNIDENETYDNLLYNFDEKLRTLSANAEYDYLPNNCTPGQFVYYRTQDDESCTEKRNRTYLATMLLYACMYCMPSAPPPYTLADIIKSIIDTSPPSDIKELNKLIQHGWEIAVFLAALCDRLNYLLITDAQDKFPIAMDCEMPPIENAKIAIVQAIPECKEWIFYTQEYDKYSDGKLIDDFLLRGYYLQVSALDPGEYLTVSEVMKIFDGLGRKELRNLKQQFEQHVNATKERYNRIKLSCSSREEDDEDAPLFSLFSAQTGDQHSQPAPAGDGEKKKKKKKRKHPEEEIVRFDCAQCGADGAGCMGEEGGPLYCFECSEQIKCQQCNKFDPRGAVDDEDDLYYCEDCWQYSGFML